MELGNDIIMSCEINYWILGIVHNNSHTCTCTYVSWLEATITCNALTCINVKQDPSPMGRVTGLGGDSIDFRLPGKGGVFERTRGRLGDCPCACAVFTGVRTTKPYVV